MSTVIAMIVGGIVLFCAGYAVGHKTGSATVRGLREAIAGEIARSVIKIDEMERDREKAGKRPIPDFSRM